MELIYESIITNKVQIQFTPKEVKDRLESIKIEYFEISDKIPSCELYENGWLCVCINYLSTKYTEKELQKLNEDIKNNSEQYYKTFLYGFGETKVEAFQNLNIKTETEFKKYSDNLDLMIMMNQIKNKNICK